MASGIAKLTLYILIDMEGGNWISKHQKICLVAKIILSAGIQMDDFMSTSSSHLRCFDFIDSIIAQLAASNPLCALPNGALRVFAAVHSRRVVWPNWSSFSLLISYKYTPIHDWLQNLSRSFVQCDNVAAFVYRHMVEQRNMPIEAFHHVCTPTFLWHVTPSEFTLRSRGASIKGKMTHDESRPSTAGWSDALSEGSQNIIPDFRRDLEASAPGLLDKFDSILRINDDRLEDYGRRYNKVRAHLARERTTSLLERSETISPTDSTEEPNYVLSNGEEPQQRPESSGFGSETSVDPVPIQQAVRSKHRIPLSDTSTDSSAQATSPVAAQQAVRSKQRIPLTDSTKSSIAQPKSPSVKVARPLTTSETILTIKVQIRLLPVLLLLKKPDQLPKTRLEARSIAQGAFDFARDNGASDALIGRCCFYIGRSYHDAGLTKPSRDATNWFQRATLAAEAGYPEGQLAQECLNRYESLTLNSRPNSSSSWLADKVNVVWSTMWSKMGNGAASPVAPKPRPEPIRTDGKEGARVRFGGGERIPSFSTAGSDESSRPPSSAGPPSSTSTGTRDHHGLKWSPKSPWGKGIEFVQSPEPIYEDPEDEVEEEEQYVPANVLGGLVEAGALSPAMQRSPGRTGSSRRSNSMNYVPAASRSSNESRPRNLFWVTNPSSPSTEPEILSPYSQDRTNKDPAENKKTSSYFPTRASRTHARAQSAVTFASPPVKIAIPPVYSQSEPSGSPTTSRMPSRRGRNSLSLIIKATGLDVYRKRDEAAQMEEGESPFRPREEEAGLYRRRASDVVDDDA